jgi:hypothetical protein
VIVNAAVSERAACSEATTFGIMAWAEAGLGPATVRSGKITSNTAHKIPNERWQRAKRIGTECMADVKLKWVQSRLAGT